MTRAFLGTLFANHWFRTVFNGQKPNNYYFHDWLAVGKAERKQTQVEFIIG